jgi:hypothetical protein
MDFSTIFMWLGFLLACYAVVGNDVIQTLGTFLTSNEKRQKWYVLWAYAGSILALVLIYGYSQNDISYGRLEKFVLPEVYEWYFLLPPIVLIIITRFGIPVSTTFMVLTLFSLQTIPNDLWSMTSSIFDRSTQLGGMIQKSVMGYLLALSSGIFIYLIVSRATEKKFIDNPINSSRNMAFWTVAQWLSTGFLWSQWLMQDLSNVFIYLRGGAGLSMLGFIFSVIFIIGFLGYIFYIRGGAVQEVVRAKINTADIRSATFVDLIYGIILYIFKYDYFGLWGGKIPMSTTWVFIGLLAGREIAIRFHTERKWRETFNMIFADLGKVFFGLVVSVFLVFIIKFLAV